MEMVKTKGFALVLAAMLAFACMLVGCSDDQAASESGTTEAARVVVGSQAEASKAIILTNGLGVDVTDVGVNVSGSKDEPAVLAVSDAWADGSDAMVFLPEAYEAAPSDLVLTAGKKEFVLHDVDFSAFEDADVMVEEKVAYLSYEVDGKAITTLDHEKDIADKAAAEKKAKAEAKKKAEAEKKAQEEAEAAAAAEAEAAAAAEEEVYYEEPAAETYYEEPAAEEAPAQSSDQCIEGGVALR